RRVLGGRPRTRTALGQLRLAERFSRLGAASAQAEPQARFTAAAFTGAPAAAAADLGVGAGAISESGGAAGPAVDQGELSRPIPPALDEGEDKTPYDAKTPQDLIAQAEAAKRLGVALIAGGLALLAIAIALITSVNPTAKVLGAVLAAAAAGMMAFGMLQVSIAQRKADEAKRQADGIDKDYGQKDQAGVLRDGADRAVR
ncbi:MAG: hypothetical protein HY928_01955, partial [Elusimicrobia bacterium]|nr:hypothetical protein [Elusimicrobiota bacterium]